MFKKPNMCKELVIAYHILLVGLAVVWFISVHNLGKAKYPGLEFFTNLILLHVTLGLAIFIVYLLYVRWTED